MPSFDDRHGRKVAGLFGRIASWYDFLNHFLSLGQDCIWRKRLTRHVRSAVNGTVLDLAAGTMDVTREIKNLFPSSRVVSMDFSWPMLVRGRKKMSGKRGCGVFPVLADAKAIPLAGEDVDCVTIAFGIRNIHPRAEAFSEIHRVLKPGGRLCVLEFGTGRKRVLKGIYNFYLRRILPFLGRFFSGDETAYSYLAQSIENFPDAGSLAREMSETGFSRVFYYPLSWGIVYVHVAQKSEPAGDKDEDKPGGNGQNTHFTQASRS